MDEEAQQFGSELSFFKEKAVVLDIVANIYCLKAEYLKKSDHLLKGNILGYELKQNKSFDIDSKYDLEIVKMFFKKIIKNV